MARRDNSDYRAPAMAASGVEMFNGCYTLDKSMTDRMTQNHKHHVELVHGAAKEQHLETPDCGFPRPVWKRAKGARELAAEGAGAGAAEHYLFWSHRFGWVFNDKVGRAPGAVRGEIFVYLQSQVSYAIMGC